MAAPFPMAPDPRFFFLGSSHQSALSKLYYGMQTCSPGILVTGPHGAGKTFMLRLLIHTLPPEKYNVGLLFNPPLGTDQLLPELMYQLDVPISNGGPQEQLRELSDRIISDHLRGIHTLLLIDEAQLLPPESLEQLRVLANYQLDAQSPVTLILSGLPSLRPTLAPNVALLQRFAISVSITPLTPRETVRYVLHRLRCAGAVRAIFTDEALQSVQRHSGGVPRLINALCDASLLEGWTERRTYVEGYLVEKVARASAFRVASPVAAGFMPASEEAP
ncbi:MAG: AAA family ATPase [Nitrospirae bacterium]|nr:AAA family ATPase [Nitrospirota bacterium]